MYGSANPVEDRFGFKTRGKFRCSRSTERISVILVFVITVIVFIVFYRVWGAQLLYIYGMHYETAGNVAVSHIQFFALAFSLITLFIFAAGFVAVKIILIGVEYSYTADSNVFSFCSAKDNVSKTDISYSDVIAVRFDERRLFGLIKRGYTVTIITHTLGTVTLEYIFNKSISEKSPENTPFNIIKIRSDKADEAFR